MFLQLRSVLSPRDPRRLPHFPLRFGGTILPRHDYQDLSSRSSTISRRDLPAFAIFWIAALSILVAFVTVSLIYASRRRRRLHPLPTTANRQSFVSIWSRWPPWPWSSAADRYQRTSGDDGTTPDLLRRNRTSTQSLVTSFSTASPSASFTRHNNRSSGPSPLLPSQSQPSVATSEAPLDRSISVRSTITLPAYRPTASDAEQVLGREGERDGIDIVVERPTEEEEEALREEEMAALFEIRQFRRQQQSERAERQRQRREARERNDAVALEALRTRTRFDGPEGRLNDLRREHERVKEQRKLAGSRVSYADVGIARNDGSRVRPGFSSVASSSSSIIAPSTLSTTTTATSSSSAVITPSLYIVAPPPALAAGGGRGAIAGDESVGLLSDAASIAALSTTHSRDRSSGSVFSIDSEGHSPLPSPRYSRSRADSTTSTVHVPSLGAGNNNSSATPVGAGSSPEMIETDLADWEITAPPPPNSPPPGYDEVSLLPEPSPEPEPERYPPAPAPEPARIPRLPSLRLRELPEIVLEPMPGQQSKPQP